MIIVIDAYNALKTTHGLDISSTIREEYVAKLKRYAKKKKHTVMLVFDGGFSDWQSREKHGNLIVIYSGYKESADDVIKRYLEDNYHKDILLVTADRELVDHAAVLNLVALTPLLFNSYIERALEKKTTGSAWAQQEAHKMHAEDNNVEIDALMEQASIKIVHKDNEGEAMKRIREPRSFTFSKKDKKLTSKLKKL